MEGGGSFSTHSEKDELYWAVLRLQVVLLAIKISAVIFPSRHDEKGNFPEFNMLLVSFSALPSKYGIQRMQISLVSLCIFLPRFPTPKGEIKVQKYC